MNFIIGQGISVIALVTAIVIAQFKELNHILIGEVVANLAISLSYFFLGGISGAWICLVAAIQTIIIYSTSRYALKERGRRLLMALFAAVYVAGTAVVYSGWADVVSCLCAIIYLLAIMQKYASRYRWFMAANSLLWVIYDITTLAYVNVVTHGMLLVSLTIAMVRLDLKGEQENDKRI